jgi:prolyl oligopeptidase PreP (S9A serine peptidase family)
MPFAYRVVLASNEIINSQNMGQLQAYGIYNEYILRNIYLSPGHKYLVVEVVKNRTTVVADFLIYKISDFSLPIAHIKDTFYTGFLWEGEDTIIYSPKLNFEYVFKYDLISGQQYYLPNNRKSLQSVLDTKIQYENDYIWLNGEEKPTQTLRLKHYETDVFDTKNISYLVSDEDSSAYLVPRLSNDKSILFSSGSRNPTHLVFVGYKEVENKEIKISNINAFKIPLKGSIQKYFKLGNHYLVVYLSGIKKRYYIFDEDGNLEIDLEAPIGKLQKINQIHEDQFTMHFSSEVNDKYLLNFSLKDANLWNPKFINKELLTDQEGIQYNLKFLESTSLDGTKVPIRVLYRKEAPISSKSALYILGYGGHGIVTYFLPNYEVGLHSYLKSGGIYATPAVRGGGEFGNEWYTQVFGSLVRYEDMESAVVELHKRGYGSPETTAFEGWSSGGLLAGVMMTRNPELFKLVIPGNGLHDMERHEVLQGPFEWSQDYGNSRSVEAIEFLRSYSPVYNAKKKRIYPTVYTMVGDQDVRVNPSQSYKITAVLQDYQIGVNPIILDRYPTAGHWIQDPLTMNGLGVTALQRKWRVVFNELGLE